MFILRGHRLYLQSLNIVFVLANSADPDEMAHSVAFHQGLHGLQEYPRDISGPEYEWAMKMGQEPMSHSFACKNQDFDRSFEIVMGHLEKK